MKKKICIIIADYYPDITKMLMSGVLKEIQKHNLKSNLKILNKPILVPGVFEIPVTVSKFIKKYDAFIVLGCVIKGETPHFDFISKAVISGLIEISIKNKKPIGNGIITCLNKKQAIDRADISKKNKGKEAARAVIKTLSNFN